jgi:hypothetical protein
MFKFAFIALLQKDDSEFYFDRGLGDGLALYSCLGARLNLETYLPFIPFGETSQRRASITEDDLHFASLRATEVAIRK